MKPIVILGIFVADTAYRADRMPRMGETILGRTFALGPGGKGSNQSVAAAMAQSGTAGRVERPISSRASGRTISRQSPAAPGARQAFWPK